jgi:hypothetical protein
MNILVKLQKIQALIDRASSEGERQAAELAKQRLHERFQEDMKARPIEIKVTSNSEWEKKLFSAICKKNGFNPYRYARQKHTTTMVRVSMPIMKGVLWPQYEKYTELLREMFDAIALDLIDKIYKDDKEEAVISGEISCGN